MAKITDDQVQYETVCKDRFDQIIGKLDELNNKLFVGNGQPSLMVRVDRLEQCKKTTAKAFWIAVTAMATAIVGVVVRLWK